MTSKGSIDQATSKHPHRHRQSVGDNWDNRACCSFILPFYYSFGGTESLGLVKGKVGLTLPREAARRLQIQPTKPKTPTATRKLTELWQRVSLCAFDG